MSFSKCPECSETNFFESGYSVRNFDCGFKGQWDTRTARCGGKVRRPTAAPTISDEAARYRLALLDAAQVADTIGMDMTSTGNGGDFAGRCHQLALQMRAFAGHTIQSGSFDELSPHASKSRRPGTALMAIVRKVRPW